MSIKILWADDEIDLLKPQLLFLEKKGYEVTTVTNGYDALDELGTKHDFDLVFLDESMPGLTGLETLSKLKETHPSTPVVMITKNEAEHVMEEAIGSQISDYLIKPVNPNQILLTIKKLVDEKRLVQEKTNSDYQQDFRHLLMEINSGLDVNQWVDIYKKLINWELKLDNSNSEQMGEILATQKSEANKAFGKFISRHYEDWMQGHGRPIMSDNLMREKILPYLNKDVPTVMVLLDNMRYDQWKVIEPMVTSLYKVEEEDFFYSILPTSTQYSRNAIFAGMMPADIEKHYKEWWAAETDEGGKNNFEAELFGKQLERISRKGDIKWDYTKVTRTNFARQMQDRALDFLNNDFSIIVYNFIDMMSHARTEMEVLKELAGDEKAYRSLTRSWFENSPLWATLRRLADRDVQLFITTDHGTIRVNTPSKVVGDRDTSTNLRYKLGRNLQYNSSDVMAVRDPKAFHLPMPNISSSYIFAKEDTFFLYPNNYNYYNNYYRNTFQHGGISLEEVICPIVRLKTK